MNKQKRIYGAKTKRRTYTVTDEVHAELQRLGQGNASRGVREAVKSAQGRVMTEDEVREFYSVDGNSINCKCSQPRE